MAMIVEDINQSRIAMYLKCPRQFYYRYCEGIISPPGAALTLGSSFHRAIAVNYGQKVGSYEDLPVSDVLDAYDTTFNELSHDTVWNGDNAGKVKDAGYRVLGHYQEEVAPETYPLDVEQSFRFFVNWIDNDEEKSVEFKGILDLEDVKGNLVEIKTTGQTPRQPSGDHVIQLIGYAIGKEAISKRKPSAWLDYLVTLKTPKILSFPIDIDEGKKKFFLGNIPRVVKAMESENYYPARGNRWCSKSACFYWDMCVKEFGG